METVERIGYFEEILDEALGAVEKLSMALDEYAQIRGKLDELKQYYFGEEWRQDRFAEEAGWIPQNMKRGVLSEDGVYNLVTDEYELLERMRDIVEEIEPSESQM